MVEMVTKLPVKTEARPARETAYGMERPWYPIESLRRGIDRMFADFDLGLWPTSHRRAFFDYEPTSRLTAGFSTLTADFTETPDGFEIRAELPGVEEKDIEVKLVEGGLVIKGEKKEEKHENETGYVMSERSFGTFERFFGLPRGVDMDKVSATFSKGILTVKLPKTVEAKQHERKIAVKAA